jgi:hypothetical protein
MEEAPENSKELSNSAHANGMHEWITVVWLKCINKPWRFQLTIQVTCANTAGNSHDMAESM